MECGEARALIDPYLDGEFALERTLELERHLEGCADCAALLASRRALSAALRGKLAYHAAPLSLHGRVRAAIAAAEPSRRARALPAPWLRMAASFFLVAGLSAALTYSLVPRETDLVPDEVFASHVRGMLSGTSGIDVVSSDEHTVKPWFAGKLDFSPPVVDLASDGFPLAGGRVDYLAGRTVAALVYRHKKHVITLFVWPQAGPARAIAASARRGDNLDHWSDGRMAYWAISDLNAEELADFARHYAAAAAAGETESKRP
ncbi:MAG TPA: anti-sigma factor [Alphaproteobacteria bacterium]|nr:anti-sigma factor [Alphaproteobacteria bacterium]